MNRKLLSLLLCFALLFSAVCVVDVYGDVFNGEVDAGNNDSGSEGTSSSSQFMGYLIDGNEFASFRFDGVTIPADSTVDEAYLSIYSFGQTGTPNLKIVGFDEDDTADFSGDEGDGRDETSAQVDWDNPGNGYPITSPDIAAVVQEIVSRGGWASGNALGMKIVNDGAGSGNYLRCWCYEFGSGFDAEISITYTEGGGADTYTIKYGALNFNSTMIGTNANFSVVWNSNGTFADCGFIFGWNFSGSPSNDTFTAFSGSSSPQTANVTKSLGENLTMWDYTVQWQVWANNTDGDWNATNPQNLTLTAVRLTYTVNEHGSLLVNGTSKGNTTETYLPTTDLSFAAIPSENYTLDKFTLNSVEYTNNPLQCSFNVSDYTSNLLQTLIVTFAEGGAAADTTELEQEWLVLGLVASIITGGTVASIFIARRKEE